ncbi:MAG: hypothetical protein KDB24_10555 [Microthrixaceae bacterium]|nr:hypothetical protein [Microthrixaceae bacterium]
MNPPGAVTATVALWSVMAAAGGRRGRRAALRGLMAVGATRAAIRVVRTATGHDPAPSPSHPAAVGALLAATALESSPWTVPAAVVGMAALRAEPRRTGALVEGVQAAGGAGVALATLRWWPRIDTSPARAPRAARPHQAAVEPDGTGLVVVANPGAGSGEGDEAIDEIRRGLPGARIVTLEEGDNLIEVAQQAAESAASLGVLGGDGSINALATVAKELGLPLAVFPGGTLNHFARDLGLTTVADGITAVAGGTVIEVDTGSINGRLFLNTASVGSYPALVAAREELEDHIGKWPAMLVALVRVLRATGPTHVTIDGRERRIWMIFIGNGAYRPAGFAPTDRPRLDDGLLDVRLVDGARPGARSRLVASLLTGTLGRSRVYERRLVERLELRVTDDRTSMMATDGEAFDGSAEIEVLKHPRSLLVHVAER